MMPDTYNDQWVSIEKYQELEGERDDLVEKVARLEVENQKLAEAYKNASEACEIYGKTILDTIGAIDEIKTGT
jgi:hypothetical protein